MLAPERAEKLNAICSTYDINTIIEDEPRFRIRACLETNRIYLPIAAMEYVWTRCLQFWVVTQEYRKAQHRGRKQLNLDGNERLRKASQVVTWSAGNLQQSGHEPWPSKLPRPRRRPKGEDSLVANELFLGAMGWIILHEVGHITLQHAELAGSYSQEQERAADLFATRWVLDGIDQVDPRFNKRLLCISAALLCLQSFETLAAPRWNSTHPPAHERMSYCLDKYRSIKTEKVIAFVVVSLQLLFTNTRVSANIEGLSFDEILDDLFFSITRQNC